MLAVDEVAALEEGEHLVDLMEWESGRVCKVDLRLAGPVVQQREDGEDRDRRLAVTARPEAVGEPNLPNSLYDCWQFGRRLITADLLKQVVREAPAFEEGLPIRIPSSQYPRQV